MSIAPPGSVVVLLPSVNATTTLQGLSLSAICWSTASRRRIALSVFSTSNQRSFQFVQTGQNIVLLGQFQGISNDCVCGVQAYLRGRVCVLAYLAHDFNSPRQMALQRRRVALQQFPAGFVVSGLELRRSQSGIYLRLTDFASLCRCPNSWICQQGRNDLFVFGFLDGLSPPFHVWFSPVFVCLVTVIGITLIASTRALILRYIPDPGNHAFGGLDLTGKDGLLDARGRGFSGIQAL